MSSVNTSAEAIRDAMNASDPVRVLQLLAALEAERDALVAERDAARQAEVDADAALGSVADDLQRVTAARDRLAARVAELEGALRVLTNTLWIDGPNAEDIINTDALDAAIAALAGSARDDR